MKGLQKYLFGGLIGAIIGFLIAPKRAQKVREALFGRESRPALPPHLMKSLTPGLFPPEGAGLSSPPESFGLPSFAPESLETSYPQSPGSAAWSPAPAPAAAGPEAPAPEAFTPEVPAPEAPQVSSPSTEVSAPLAEACPAPDAAPVEPSGAVCAAVDAEPWPDEDQAKLTRTPETLTPPPELVSEEESVRLAEPATDLVVEAEEVAIEADEPELGAGGGSIIEVEPMEQAEEEEPRPANEHEPAVPSSKAAMEADLRARIEETRRRIREEMERPFRIAAGQTDEPIELAAPEKAAPGKAAPDEEMPPVNPVADTQPVISRATAQTEAEAAPTDRQQSDENRFDYDEMRRRIEETRQRLKSKAFDAMMSGETSLLAREKSGSKPLADAPKLSLDREVDQTIESGLAEEDL